MTEQRCIHEKNLAPGGWCQRGCCYCTATMYSYCQNKEFPLQTNADYIRSMTDEELSKLFIDSPCHGMSCADAPHTKLGSSMCVECQLKWLKQPYKEEKEDG